MTLSAGTMLGPYEIISIAGSGGMGEVYRAKDTRLDRTVAIKVLPIHLSSNPDLRQRFEREAKAISNLNHPHICILYDVGHQDGTDFLIMEYLDGETLADRLKKGAIPLQQTRDPIFSPNGHWVAYSSGDLGLAQVYVRAFGKNGGKWQVSTDQAFGPRWSRDGRQLYFVQFGPPARLFAVEVNPSEESFQAGQPKMIFEGEFGGDPLFATYDIHPDGKRIVALQREIPSDTHLQFVFNWFTEFQSSNK